jgi:hypothetical protein
VGVGVGEGVLVDVQPATIIAIATTVIASANAISLDAFMKMTPSFRLICIDLAFGAIMYHVPLRRKSACKGHASPLPATMSPA